MASGTGTEQQVPTTRIPYGVAASSVIKCAAGGVHKLNFPIWGRCLVEASKNWCPENQETAWEEKAEGEPQCKVEVHVPLHPAGQPERGKGFVGSFGPRHQRDYLDRRWGRRSAESLRGTDSNSKTEPWNPLTQTNSGQGCSS